MATNRFRVTLVSQEQKGASKPNIMFLAFSSAADAIVFGGNFSAANVGGGICSAVVTSVDNAISENYALPYPAGTEYSGRIALYDSTGGWENVSWSNAPAAFAPATRVPALIAAGFQLVGKDDTILGAPTGGNAQVFALSPSI